MPDVTVQDLIRQEAQRAGVPVSLALGVAEQESGFNPTVINPDSGAIGTFQFLPSTAKSRGIDANDPVQNIKGGVGYLRELLDRHNGDLNKVLTEYGGVKDDTTYVPGVLQRVSKFATSEPQGTTVAPPPTDAGAPPPPAPATPQTAKTSMMDRLSKVMADMRSAGDVQREGQKAMAGSLVEGGKGFLRTAVNSSTRINNMIRSRLLGLPDEAPAKFGPETTTAGKVGAAIEPVAEFAAGSTLAGGVPAVARAGALVKAGAQALSGYGVTKAQGGSDTSAQINAALGAAGPLATKALQLRAPVILANAEKKLGRVLATGLENKGPMVDYALKTGEAVTPDVKRSVGIVGQAASDLLDTPIAASWGKLQTTLAKQTGKKVGALKEALSGPLGSQEVPTHQLVEHLDNLIETTSKHFAELPSGDYGYKTFNEPLAKALRSLRDQIGGVADAEGVVQGGYGPSITVRNLSDIKRVWDDAVYTLSTAGKVGLSPEALTATAEKEAKELGANAIRQILAQDVPSIAELNQAVSHSIRLQDLANKLYEANPTMSPALKNAVTALGMGTGAILTPGGYAGHILGASLGGAASRALVSALESPLWKTLGPQSKARLAKFITDGNGEAVLKTVAPLLQSGVSANSGELAGATK